MRKIILIDQRAKKEIKDFPRAVQVKLYAAINVLGQYGKIDASLGKKISSELFEIRIKLNNCYRCIYAYYHIKEIVVLSAFVKKQQKTPLLEMKKAKNRLREYK